METAEEIKIVQSLTGLPEDRIELHNDGFLSRGYVIDNGRLVFKFGKRPDVSYADEIRSLEYLAGQDLGVNMQRVAFLPPDGSWLGLHGVPGISLAETALDDAGREHIGRQLGQFLRKLHSLAPPDAKVVSLENLISAWQNRYAAARKTLEDHFSSGELARIDRLMMREMPNTLRRLGDKRVLSHADLGDGNILIDEHGRLGVIDVSGCAYMDEASDFMDVSDDALCSVMLHAYGADDVLRAKVEMQRRIRPIFVLDVYANRGEEAVRDFVQQIRQRLSF